MDEIEKMAFELGISLNIGGEPKTKISKIKNASIEECVVESKQIKRQIKNDEIHFIKAKALDELCVTPKKNEQYRIITQKQFNAYALILSILKNNEIEEMYMSTYRINEPTVLSITELINSGKIKKATFVISTMFASTIKHTQWAENLKEFCELNPTITNHIYAHNHSKVFCCKTSNNNYFIFEGSGNMSDNARIEQYIYENNKQVFEFHKSWMLSLIK